MSSDAVKTPSACCHPSIDGMTSGSGADAAAAGAVSASEPTISVALVNVAASAVRTRRPGLGDLTGDLSVGRRRLQSLERHRLYMASITYWRRLSCVNDVAGGAGVKGAQGRAPGMVDVARVAGVSA